MRNATWYLAPAALLLSATLLSSCGSKDSSTSTTTTTTPTNTMGTDSAAMKTGGMADTSKMAAPAGGAMMADSTKMK